MKENRLNKNFITILKPYLVQQRTTISEKACILIGIILISLTKK